MIYEDELDLPLVSSTINKKEFQALIPKETYALIKENTASEGYKGLTATEAKKLPLSVLIDEVKKVDEDFFKGYEFTSSWTRALRVGKVDLNEKEEKLLGEADNMMELSKDPSYDSSFSGSCLLLNELKKRVNMTNKYLDIYSENELSEIRKTVSVDNASFNAIFTVQEKNGIEVSREKELDNPYVKQKIDLKNLDDNNFLVELKIQLKSFSPTSFIGLSYQIQNEVDRKIEYLKTKGSITDKASDSEQDFTAEELAAYGVVEESSPFDLSPDEDDVAPDFF